VTLILDSGALVAVDRGSREMQTLIESARDHGIKLRTSAVVVAEVWRDPTSRQARLARLLRAVDVRAVDEESGRRAGILLGRASMSDPADAIVVLLAEEGDTILTSDVTDVSRLVRAAGTRVDVVPV
jgi:hypothetical protein